MKRTDITNLFPDATDEQVQALMDIHGSDINAVRNQLTSANATIAELQAAAEANGAAEANLQAAEERANGLQTELDALRSENTIRDIRSKVAAETGVPLNLLTAITEEECTEQAMAILEYAKPSAYPSVRDGGEPQPPAGKKSTRNQFDDWMKKVFE